MIAEEPEHKNENNDQLLDTKIAVASSIEKWIYYDQRFEISLKRYYNSVLKF